MCLRLKLATRGRRSIGKTIMNRIATTPDGIGHRRGLGPDVRNQCRVHQIWWLAPVPVSAILPPIQISLVPLALRLCRANHSHHHGVMQAATQTQRTTSGAG